MTSNAFQATHDEDLPDRMPIAESDHTQLSPGRPELQMSFGLVQDDFVAARTRFEPRYNGRTVPVKGWLALLLPLRWTGQYVFNGSVMDRCSIGLSVQSEGYFTRGENAETVGAGIRLDSLKRDLAALTGVGPDDLPLNSGPLRLPHQDFAYLRDRLVRASTPPQVDDPNRLSGAELREDILETLLGVLPGLSKTDRDEKDGLIVRRAEECFMASQPRQPSLVELCRAAGVGKNRLYAAFRFLFDETPLTYFHKRRYSAAYRFIRRARPERGLIKRVAIDQGFTELGRFSVEYRRIFGETPSQTADSNLADRHSVRSD